MSSIGVKGDADAYGIDVEVPHQVSGTRCASIARGRSLRGIPQRQEAIFEAEDDTFAEAGKVGLWTKLTR